MLEFVGSDLYFVLDKKKFINPLLQVGLGRVFSEHRRHLEYVPEKNDLNLIYIFIYNG